MSAKRGYSNVFLPETLAARIDLLQEACGLRTRTDVVRFGVTLLERQIARLRAEGTVLITAEEVEALGLRPLDVRRK